jgi:hypothetical protein
MPLLIWWMSETRSLIGRETVLATNIATPAPTSTTSTVDHTMTRRSPRSAKSTLAGTISS